jgi:hypothetical protein
MIRSVARNLPARFTLLLTALFAACIVRLWLMPLSSSLWVDEIVTTFVLRFPHDPSFAVAPQVPDSLYYWLPRASWALFGSSETALRLPSVLAMGLALLFIARIARRLIHPRAAWLAVFVCLALSRIDYFAIDARPYAFGIAVSSASVLFLIRWLDRGRWSDELIFAFCAALLWRIHLLYWPFYLVYPAYAAARIFARDTKAGAVQIAAAAVLIPAALAPVVLTALGRLTAAQSHVFNPAPSPRAFVYMIHVNVVLICGGVAWLLRHYARRTPDAGAPHAGPVSRASWLLIVCWWLVCPVCLFGYSWLSGNGVFIARYVSLMEPGIALAATALTARFLPENGWQPAAMAVGLAAVFLMGQWFVPWPSHEPDDWRGASALERTFADDRTPVLCASPFIEAQPPVWTPEYPLPGFLFANLTYYPIRGKPELFPFMPSAQAQRYADSVFNEELLPAGRFVLYGSRLGTGYLFGYLAHRRELAHWRIEQKRFGDIFIALFESDRPQARR